ncbi:ribonuclease H family protein [Streptomyces boninensis]|uniref:ribonuclease H family protein n=1 Tax=Streptomyces boninensis TaxID=2039455 RepID=UPI003B21C50C
MTDLIIAACDGASKGNPGRAAWGWAIAGADGSVERWEAGPLGTSTNNIAELTALLRVLEATDAAVPLEVRMDSTYAMKAVREWLPGWRKRGWKTAAGKPVANQELIVAIDAALAGREVGLVYVAAHQVDGDPYNAAADAAASYSARTQEAIGSAYGSELPEGDAPTKPAKPAGVPAARKRASGGGTVKAKFAGRCRCGRSYEVGATIAKNSDGWGHVDCAKVGAAER